MKLFIVCLALVGFAGQAYAGGLPSCRTISSTGVAAVAGISEDGQNSVSFLIKRDQVSCEHMTSISEGYSLNLPGDIDGNLAWVRMTPTVQDEDGNQIYSRDMFVGELFGSPLHKPLLPLKAKRISIKVVGFDEILVSL